MEEDEDDPVVKTIDVYLNRILSSDGQSEIQNPIYLLQYLLRPSDRPYGDQGQLTTIKYRAVQKTLQFTYRLDTQGQHKEAEERPVLNGESDLDIPAYNNKSPPIQTYDSMKSTPSQSSLALGFIKDDKMYVTPVTSVLQFRPSFTYSRLVSRCEVKASEEPVKSNQLASPSGGPSSSGEGLSVGSVLPPRSRLPFSKQRELDISEPWIPIGDFYDADSHEAYEMFKSLRTFKARPGQSPMESGTQHCSAPMAPSALSAEEAIGDIVLDSDLKTYFEHACQTKACLSNQIKLDTFNSGPLSYLSLSRLSLDKQVVTILKHRHIISTQGVMQMLTSRISESELVQLLSNYADLILGNWVVRSEVLYSDITAHCRDIIVFMLLNGKPIIRDALKPYMGHLNRDKITSLLREVAIFRNNAWSMKLPPDFETQEKYPHLTAQALKKFDKQQMILHMEKIKKLSSQAETSNLLDCIEAPVLAKIIREVLACGCQRIEDIIASTKHQLLAYARQFESGYQQTVMTVVNELTEDPLRPLLNEHGVHLGLNYFTLKPNQSQEVINVLRGILIRLFQNQVASATTAQTLGQLGLSKTMIKQEYNQLQIPFEVTDSTFRKVLKEFADNRQGLWIFKGLKLPT